MTMTDYYDLEGQAELEVAFPFYVDSQGLIAGATYDLHVRQMIKQLIFTSTGERVNRPDFGCGLDRLVFAAAGDEMITVTQSMVQSELQRWLGDIIRVIAVDVQLRESTLTVTIDFQILQTGQVRKEVFKWES